MWMKVAHDCKWCALVWWFDNMLKDIHRGVFGMNSNHVRSKKKKIPLFFPSQTRSLKGKESTKKQENLLLQESFQSLN